MAQDPINVAAYSTLASGISAAATSLSVASGEGARFPATSSGAYNICIWDTRYPTFDVAYRNSAAEIVRVTTRSTDTFTVTRAQEGTSAVAFNTTGVTYRVEQNSTPKYFTDRDLPSQTSASGKFLTSDGTTASWGVVRTLVTVYCGQISSGSTVYTNVGYGSNTGTEDNVLSVSANNFSVKNLRVRCIGNGAASVTVTIRQNSGDTALAATAGGGGTGQDTTDTIAYQGGGGTDDSFAIKIVATASGFAVNVWVTYEQYITA